MKILKKANDQMITMSKTRLNVGVSMVLVGGVVYGAALTGIVLDSFMGGAIDTKISDTVTRMKSIRRSCKARGINFGRYVAESIAMRKKSADDPSDDQILSEITEFADYAEACRSSF